MIPKLQSLLTFTHSLTLCIYTLYRRSLFSLSVEDDKQGTGACCTLQYCSDRVFAALSVIANIETLVQLFVPLALGQLYGRTLHWIPFACLASIAVAFCVLSLFVTALPSASDAKRQPQRSSFLFGGSFVNVPNSALAATISKHEGDGDPKHEGDGDPKHEGDGDPKHEHIVRA